MVGMIGMLGQAVPRLPGLVLPVAPVALLMLVAWLVATKGEKPLARAIADGIFRLKGRFRGVRAASA